MGYTPGQDMGYTFNVYRGISDSEKNCYTLRRKPLKAQLAGVATKCVAVRPHAKSAFQARTERRKCNPCLVSKCYPCPVPVPRGGAAKKPPSPTLPPLVPRGEREADAGVR